MCRRFGDGFPRVGDQKTRSPTHGDPSFSLTDARGLLCPRSSGLVRVVGPVKGKEGGPPTTHGLWGGVPDIIGTLSTTWPTLRRPTVRVTSQCQVNTRVGFRL